MAKSAKQSNLGRGLAALLGEEDHDDEDVGKKGSAYVAIEYVHPSTLQPRRAFDEDALKSLADSIQTQGILQPIVVRPHPGKTGEYEIIAGERRWRAAQMAKLSEIPVLSRELSDSQALEWALVENVQRSDLNPLEEAEGYQRLIKDFGHRQEDLAKLIGKSRPHITNTLRLMQLPDALKPLLKEGKLSAGHARALLNVENPIQLAEEVIERGLSVRQTEERARIKQASGDKPHTARRASNGKAQTKDADTVQLESDLEAHLGLSVDLQFDGQGGSLRLNYKNLEQLDRVIDILLERK